MKIPVVLLLVTSFGFAGCASHRESARSASDEAAGTGTMATSGPAASPATNSELEFGTKHGSPASE